MSERPRVWLMFIAVWVVCLLMQWRIYELRRSVTAIEARLDSLTTTPK